MNWRYRFTLLFFLVTLVLVIMRLFYWQVVRAQELSAIAQAQYDEQVVTPAQRGEIKTSDGFTIVANKLAYLVYANPKVVKNKQRDLMLYQNFLIFKALQSVQCYQKMNIGFRSQPNLIIVLKKK